MDMIVDELLINQHDHAQISLSLHDKSLYIVIQPIQVVFVIHAIPPLLPIVFSLSIILCENATQSLMGIILLFGTIELSLEQHPFVSG